MTGQAKEDFEKWFESKRREPAVVYEVPNIFNMMPFSMRYGVYVDWFDSVNISAETYSLTENDVEAIVIDFNTSLDDISLGLNPTRHEARTKAIEKACEIYNKTQTK